VSHPIVYWTIKYIERKKEIIINRRRSRIKESSKTIIP
jgi:hypothetical protein